jgi:ABC-type transport system involved in multi-copper enzyme maturation permease subunit
VGEERLRHVPVLKVLLGLAVIFGVIPFLVRDSGGGSRDLWDGMLAIQWFLLMMLVISPGLTATIFSSERETRRVDFLLISRLTSRELVFGKCFGAVALLLLTLVCGAPVMAIIAATFGGVSPWEFGLGYLLLLLTGLFCASTALLYSCKAKNSSAALVQGYLISTLGLVGAVGLCFIFFFGVIWAIIEVARNLNHAARRLDDWRRHLEQDPYTLPLMQGAEDNR